MIMSDDRYDSIINPGVIKVECGGKATHVEHVTIPHRLKNQGPVSV